MNKASHNNTSDKTIEKSRANNTKIWVEVTTINVLPGEEVLIDIENNDATKELQKGENKISLSSHVDPSGKTAVLLSSNTFGNDISTTNTNKEYIKKGWWTDNKNNPITKTILGDKVRFRVETKNIDNGKVLNLTLRDWDDWVNPDDYPEGAPDKLTINNNKGFVEFTIPEKWEMDIEDDSESEIELYFDVEYKGETNELPANTNDYLIIKKEKKATIFFIGGAADKESYYFQGPNENILDAKKPFEKKINRLAISKTKYYSSYYLDYSDAKDDITDSILSKISSKKTCIYIVGHSLGGWNGAHLSEVLSKKGYSVSMLITLDPVGEGAVVYAGSAIYFKKPEPKADFWINIKTNPTNRDSSDEVASFGEQWNVSSGPNINVKVNISHAYAGSIFKKRIQNGKSAMDYLYNSVITKL